MDRSLIALLPAALLPASGAAQSGAGGSMGRAMPMAWCGPQGMTMPAPRSISPRCTCTTTGMDWFCASTWLSTTMGMLT